MPAVAKPLQHNSLIVSIERLVTTLWVGALWSIGYLAVPVLFAGLDDRILAGMLAGKMFTLVSYIGLGAGVALLVIDRMQSASNRSRRRLWLLLAMLLLVLVGEFVLQPMMAELKRQGLEPGSRQAVEFAWLHGTASLLYLINSLCGVLLLIWRPR